MMKIYHVQYNVVYLIHLNKDHQLDYLIYYKRDESSAGCPETMQGTQLIIRKKLLIDTDLIIRMISLTDKEATAARSTLARSATTARSATAPFGHRPPPDREPSRALRCC